MKIVTHYVNDRGLQEVFEVTPEVQAYALEEFGASLECETCAS